MGVERYRYADMDGFLIAAMQEINELNQDEVESIKESFRRSMIAARKVFGSNAFRKRYSKGATRLPINKALFEALSTNLAYLSDTEIDKLVQNSRLVQDSFMELCADRAFETAISQGTGNVSKVKARFAKIEDMLRRIIEHD